jgi:ComF family protein
MSESLAQRLARGLLELCFPAVCVHCLLPLAEQETEFCTPCRLPFTADTGPHCPRCAAALGPHEHIDQQGCARCHNLSYHFDEAVRLGPYEGALREAVLRLKNLSGELLAESLGRLLAEVRLQRLRDWSPSVIVPVPLHWWRRMQRKYNQAEAIAEGVAAVLRIPCEPRLVRRVRATRLQSTREPHQREENVRDAFALRPKINVQGQVVLLVDDVLTTGSTAGEVARVLRQGGAARVVVAAVAHGRGIPGG